MPVSPSVNITQAEKLLLLKLARDTLVNAFSSHQFTASPHSELTASIFGLTLGSFVTLTIHGELKGCMGCIESDRPLGKSIPDLATSSAFYDRRFSPLTEEQLERISIEISLLSPLVQLDINSQIELEHYLNNDRLGVVLSEGDHRSVFLPQVWEQLSDPKEFIEALKNKAGWPNDYWSSHLIIEVFNVLHFNEC